MVKIASHAEDFSVTVTRSDALHAEIRLAGCLNEKNVTMFTACLEQQLALGRRYGQLDLSGLESIDPSGLDSIVSAHHRFASRHGTLIMHGASPALAGLIR